MADRIYTRSGDTGATGLYSGERVFKDDPRVAACGDIDELNAVLALARYAEGGGPLADAILAVQQQLFVLGSDVATTNSAPHRACRVPDAWVSDLEAQIDQSWSALPPLTAFIVPGGTPTACHLHVARTVCRRAERALAGLIRAGELSPAVAQYLNRLSDLLFAWARAANHAASVSETTVSPNAIA